MWFVRDETDDFNLNNPYFCFQLFSLDDSCLANVLPSVTNADSNELDDPSNISIPEEFDLDNLTSLEGSSKLTFELYDD